MQRYRRRIAAAAVVIAVAVGGSFATGNGLFKLCCTTTGTGSGPIGGVTPVNTVAPAITGTPIVGNTLTVSNGTWTGVPTSFTYQWQDCNAQGVSCSPIGGATGSTYVMAKADTASSIQAQVTANNAVGSGTAAGITGPEPVNFNKISYGAGMNLDPCTNWGGAGSNTCTTNLTAAQEAQRYQWTIWQYADLTKTQLQQMVTDNPNVLETAYIDPALGGSCGTPSGTDNITNNSGTTTNMNGFVYNEDSANWQNLCYALANNHWSNGTSGGWNGAASFWDDQRGTFNMWANTGCGAGGTHPCDGYISGTLTYPWEVATISSSGAFSGCPIAAGNHWAWTCALKDFETNAVSYASGHGMPTLQVPNIDQPGDVVTVSAANGNPNWEQVAGAAGAGLAEFYTKASDPNKPTNNMANAIWSDANGVYYLAHSVPDDTTMAASEAWNTYGLATLLVVDVGGKGSWSTSACVGAYNCAATWVPEFNTALQLGPAVGGLQTRTINKNPSGTMTVYERDFANGVVISNPSNSNASLSFSPTPGGSYWGANCSTVTTTPYGSCSTLTNATTLTMGVNGGAILLNHS